jgi:hypothetical protein
LITPQNQEINYSRGFPNFFLSLKVCAFSNSASFLKKLSNKWETCPTCVSLKIISKPIENFYTRKVLTVPLTNSLHIGHFLMAGAQSTQQAK